MVCFVNRRRLCVAIQFQEKSKCARTITITASPSHSWTTSPVKRTVINGQTETRSAMSSQKVVFNRQCCFTLNLLIP